ncbi:MAG: hypothetical protein R3E82_13315 [Pseudomonadales bacterium]|nr:hypothetical protein [Pseudomonadales bacterium]
MAPLACPTEAQWYAHWGEATRRAEDPAALAALGGAAADRLAWVFVSGYQAAVRHCFPEFPDQGWTCFAAAESERSPGCTLTEADGHALLNGTKSWIAGAGSVDHLVVSIGQDESMEFVAVERTAPGVTIELPRTPTFLAEMNQGVAHFDQVSIAPDRRLQAPLRRHWFRAAEPLFILIALNACIAAHARGLASHAAGSVPAMASAAAVAAEADATAAQGRGLAVTIPDRTRIKAALADYRLKTAAVVSSFEKIVLAQTPHALQDSWRKDGRLLAMFGVAAPG